MVTIIQMRPDDAQQLTLAGSHTQPQPDLAYRNMPERLRHDIRNANSEDADLRAYVSRLWAEDWDNETDALYDDL